MRGRPKAGVGTGASSDAATVARWSRALVAVGVAFFVAWHLAVLAGYPRSATVVLGVQGFVLHVVFRKAYQLVPSYFARELAVPRAPMVHLPLAVLGTVGLFASGAGFVPASVETAVGAAGATLWFVGCLVFISSLAWTVRGNLTGAETGTGTVDRHRERVDRLANAAMPCVLGYLLVASAVPVLGALGTALRIDSLLGGSGPATSHLLAAGTAALLVFAIGFRLLPRLLVATPRTTLVAVVLPAGVVGPALLAIDLHGGRLFQLGAILQALALVGFAVAYADLFFRSERRRVGGWAVLAAVGFGVGVAVLGLLFATGSIAATAAFDLHYRFAVGGFLGLTIVGVTDHFYPPAIASRAVVERIAAVAVGALIAGLLLEAAGALADISSLSTAGHGISTLGALAYASVLGAVFLERPA